MREDVKMPGYKINDYRLMIPLSNDLQEKIQEVRRVLHEKNKVKQPFELKPALTILRFNAFEGMEPKILERIHEVALKHQPFKVELKDFSAYPSHTIYINVLTKSPFNELVKDLKKIKWMMNIPQHEPHYITEPHLIIAQQLKPYQFQPMWTECSSSEFTGKYMASTMSLFRRGVSQKNYELLRKMEFQNLPLNIKQGELFAGG